MEPSTGTPPTISQSWPLLFSLDCIHEVDRFEFWHDHGSKLFRPVSNFYKADCEPLRIKTEMHRLGPLTLSMMGGSSQSYERTPRMVKSDYNDHYLLIWLKRGIIKFDGNENNLICGDGDILLLDLAKASRSIWTAHHQIFVTIPRTLIEDEAGMQPKAHWLARSSIAAKLLSMHLCSLIQSARSNPSILEDHLGQGLVGLIKAYFCTDSCEGHGISIEDSRGLHQRTIMNWIKRNIGNIELSVEDICSRFYLSRSHLYRLFQEYGGVYNYIQEQRLIEAHLKLRIRELGPITISALARELGFKSPSAFSHAFRKRWGFSPSQFIHHHASSRSLQTAIGLDWSSKGAAVDDFSERLKNIARSYYHCLGVSFD